MLRKNNLGLILFVLGIFILISKNFTITGGVINSNFQFSFYSILGFVFIIGSFIIFASRHSLDAIIIPTGSNYEEDIERTTRAYKEHKGNKASYFVISGSLGDKKLSESQRADIYRELRKHGVKPSQMTIEGKSRNTVENIVRSLEKIKKRGGKEVGIASYPGHLDRFVDIIKRGKEEELIDKEFHVHRLETRSRKNQTPKERLYETLSGVLHRYKLRHGVEKAMKSEDEPIIKYLKKAGNFIFNPFKR